MTKEQNIVFEQVKNGGFYQASAIDTDKRKSAIRQLLKKGVLKITEMTASTILLEKNWRD